MESSVPGRLAGWDIHGFYTMEDLDVGKIKEEAGARWLRPNEIHALLCNYSYFNINVKPVDLPKGGTIVLFDRKMLRNFRRDGHNWKKKKDGKTVKEAHEHLKVGDHDRIHVYYAHGQDNQHFVRRIYWLLDKKHEHIVLVHYREVLEGSGTQSLAMPRECKEALSFSNRTSIPSPFTPVHSSSSSGSRVLSEDTESGLDCAFYAGSGTSVLTGSPEVGNLPDENYRDQELKLHELNTLDWADLVETDNSMDTSAVIRDEVPCLEDQNGYDLRGSSSHGSLLGSHNLGGEVSSFGGLTNLITRTSSFDKQTSNLPLSDTTDVKHQGNSKIVMDVRSDIFDKSIFESQDSFGRWMNFIVNDSPVSLDDLPFESPVTTNCFEPEIPVVVDQISLAEQLFSITDVSPGWGFSTEETKVLVIGYFLEANAHLAKSNLYCVFGDKQVPVETVQSGVFRCTALPSSPGSVSFYLTLDGRTPISQILTFEFRSNLTNQRNNGLTLPETDKSRWRKFELQTRLAHLLCSTTNNAAALSGKISPNALRDAKKFATFIPPYEKDWANFIKAVGNNEITISEAHHILFELSLKNQLRQWLLEKVLEGCKTTARDHMGQGVLHLCAILDYSWAVYPFSRSGLSLDFRDDFGWTALHWAAYCGGEQMVAFLLSAGANPSLVTDPTPECPGGYTAADLASIRGYEGLGAYLAEKGLTAHFEAMSVSGKISGSLQPSEPLAVKYENLNDEELCMKDSLAAYRTAANAAARIQSAFREQTLKLRTKAAQKERPDLEASHIAAALKIQHAFRNFNNQKKMMTAATQIQYRFRTWKTRKDFLNMRRHAIRIQAVFRGHLMRKQYRKILWSVGVLEKALLRWRKKRKGLRGIQAEAIEVETEDQENEVEDFYQISLKHAEERVERSVVRVQAVFRSQQAQKEYRRMKLACNQAKLEYEEFVDLS